MLSRPSKAVARLISTSTCRATPRTGLFRVTSRSFTTAHAEPIPGPSQAPGAQRKNFATPEQNPSSSLKQNVHDMNKRLYKFCQERHPEAAFHVLSEMKRLSIRPTIETYHTILRLCQDNHLGVEAAAIQSDMEAFGIPSTIQTYNSVLQANSRSSLAFDGILEKLRESGLEWDQRTFHSVIQHCAGTSELETAIQMLENMHALSLEPLHITMEMVIKLACDSGLPRLALDIAQTTESRAVKPLHHTCWTEILRVSVHHYFEDGIEKAWMKSVVKGGVVPDEGMCIQALNFAGRFGKVELANQILTLLQEKVGAKLAEHHLAPLLEAYCRQDRIQEAIQVLDRMRELEITPTSSVTAPLEETMKAGVHRIDQVYYELEERLKNQTPVDIVVLNAIVQAAANIGDLQRAIGTYKEITKFGVSPNMDTYNILLNGCIKSQHVELGEQLLKELKETGLTPNAETYQRLVLLSLTQYNYEAAFFYLEEMKSHSFKPSERVYTNIARKCAAAKDNRADLVLLEMEESGYRVNGDLRRFVETRGEEKKHYQVADKKSGLLRVKGDRFTRSTNGTDDGEADQK